VESWTLKSIDQLRAAVDSASSEARAAYVSFTIFALYFAITVGATSHEELLRGSQVTMPALGVGLPIVGFYVLVPPLFLLFHALLLIQLSVLSSRVRQLKGATSDDGDLSGPPFVLSQFLLGNIRGFLLRPMVYAAMWVSLILLPIGILVFVQVRFLPYHDEWVTWWHRILIILDLALVWLLWSQVLAPARPVAGPAEPQQDAPSERSGRARRTPAAVWRRLGPLTWRGFRHPGIALITVVIVVFSWTLATIPDSSAELPEMAERAAVCPAEGQKPEEADTSAPPPAYEICRPTWKVWEYFNSVSLPPAVAGGPVRAVSCGSYLLFETPTTPLNMRRNLQVRGADLVKAAPPNALTQELGLDRAWREHSRGLDLRGRDLRYADLSSSDLRRVDLRGADLLGANLAYADLRYARAGAVPLKDFDGCKAALRTGDLCLNRLSSASLQNADLRSSHFRKADLRQANLNYANLQGIDLTEGRLEDASLQAASLEGAEFKSAVLDRAHLKLARLAGSNLSQASLRDTCLQEADLTLAHLKEAQLAHADLSQARLDGAFLLDADLTGATLTSAYLAAADLRRTKLDDVTLGDARGEAFFSWTDMRGIDEPTLRTLFVSVLERAYGAQLPDVSFDDLKRTDAKGEPAPSWAEFARKYDGLLRAVFGSVRHDILPGLLPRADPVQYELDLALLLAGKACLSDVSSFVVRSLVNRIVDDIHMSGEYRPHQKVATRLLRTFVDTIRPIGEIPPQAQSALAEGFRASCPPAAEMPEHMRNNLRAIMVLLLL
jgi:uncharacterized protein YjbI with pentapeptide repeats